MSPSARKDIEYPEYSCPECGWNSAWEVVKCKNQGGSWQHFFMCNCGHRTNHYISKKLVERSSLLPREVQPVFPRHKCVVCGADGAEEHHWAPTHLFGDESDAWPKSFLCPKCHKRWHDRVTPNASTATKETLNKYGTHSSRASSLPQNQAMVGASLLATILVQTFPKA